MNKKAKNDKHPLIAMVKDYEENEKAGFSLKIGGTYYNVSTHFNPKGNQSVLDQFKALILADDPV